MVATVAVLSDIHGVLPVLDAVLAEPDVAAAERIVVTGDHAAGPMPVEVLDRLVGLGDRCLLVRGNADRELVEVARGRDSAIDVSNWAGRQLRPDQVDLLDQPAAPGAARRGRVRHRRVLPRHPARRRRGRARRHPAGALGRGPRRPRRHRPGRRLRAHPHAVRASGRPTAGRQLRQHRHALRAGRRFVGAAARRPGRAAPHRHRRRSRGRRGGRRVGVPGPAGVGRQYVRSANSDADAVAAFGPRDGRSADR